LYLSKKEVRYLAKIRLAGLFLLLWISSGSILWASELRSVTIDFYGQQIEVPYDAGVKPAYILFSKETPAQFYNGISSSEYRPLITSLLEKRNSLELNDWLYYQLVQKTTRQLYPNAGTVYYTLMEWFILSKSGYKTRLMHDDKKPYVFVNTPDELLDVPFFLTKEGRFINLSAINTSEEKKLQKLTILDIGYDAKARPFIFSFTEKPAILRQDTISKTLHFEHRGIMYSLPVNGDRSYIAFLRSYPKLDLSYLPSIPVSDMAYVSIIPTFRNWISNMNDAEAVRFILSFTRSAFAYETDREAYHEESFAMNPEMTLLSPYSDCEDRAILFAWMVKELLGRDVVLIEFPTHVAAAVNLPETYGTPIKYEGREYSFCEATGPQNELGIGECNERYSGISYQIVRID
jgi:hypothetical protein